MKSFATGVGAVAFCVVVSGAVVLASPDQPESQEAPAVEAGQTAATLVCGGGFERTLEEGVDVEKVDEDVSTTSWAFADPAGATLSGDDSLELKGSPSYASSDKPMEGTLTSDEVADSVQMAGANVHVAKAGDTRGMATNPCTTRSSDRWLVGSTADVGTSNQLILSNPGETAVTVNMEAFGSAGELDLGANSSVAVDAGSTERVDLDGVIPSDPRIALHVSTAAGSVGMSLQQNSLDGATPQGVSFINGSPAGKDLTIPGVTVSDGDGASVPKLRLVNPGSDKATATVTLLEEDGSTEISGASDVTVSAGSVLDLSLDGTDPGQYAVHVEGSSRLAAGIQLTSNEDKDGARDIAWAAPTDSYTSGTVMFGEAPATFGVVGESNEPVNATITPIKKDGEFGEPETLKAEPDTYASFELPKDSVGLTLESEEPVRGAVTAEPELSKGNGIDWVPLTSFEAAQSSQRIAVTN